MCPRPNGVWVKLYLTLTNIYQAKTCSTIKIQAINNQWKFLAWINFNPFPYSDQLFHLYYFYCSYNLNHNYNKIL